MRVHAFLATAAELPGLLAGGAPPARSTALTGVDPINLSSLVEIVTGDELTTEGATAVLEEPVLDAGARGPSIHLFPNEATEALGSSDPRVRARWAEEWTGGNGRPNDGPEKALEALAGLAAQRAQDQALYFWVSDAR